MPQHRDLPDYVGQNFHNPVFQKDKNPTSVKGVVPEGHGFVKKAEPKLLKTVPEAKRLINQTIKLEKDAQYFGTPPVNIFNLPADFESPSQKKLREQVASSLHPGHHKNIDYKIGLIEKRQMNLTTISTSNGRSVDIPLKVAKKRK